MGLSARATKMIKGILDSNYVEVTWIENVFDCLEQEEILVVI